MVANALTLPRMAKNQPERRPHASELRFGKRSAADLRKEAAVLMDLAGALGKTADMLEENGVRHVEIDGDKKFGGGVEKIREHIKAVQKGLVDAQ